ncbi:jmjC domain-containing protein 8 isoform X2 [Cyclopterus lumpus]|uniref:jmjC domain-containing protein 8 isoform X2 n=1 Tax=Cyclopterus lumpus TaxID=8103 RepID=UPI0014863B4E|nr:jmjC domain-containing protein 8 isoform X2 [Cyclopterus lumpus]
MENTAPLTSWTLLVLTCLTGLEAAGPPGDGGGWSLKSDLRLQDEGLCNIDVLDGSSLSHQQFLERYAFVRPVILRGLTDNTRFRSSCSRSRLLQEYGGKNVRLSTANTHSYRKVDVPLQEYVDVWLRPQSADVLGSDILYFFGDNNVTEWQLLLQQYASPPYVLPRTSGALSFGIAGPGSGVPFHWHGPGFSEVIYGRKRWFLYPPDQEPHFHPNRTTLSWVTETYPQLPEAEAPQECTISPGEVLYFPDRWWHATLNLETSVFISTFLG